MPNNNEWCSKIELPVERDYFNRIVNHSPEKFLKNED